MRVLALLFILSTTVLAQKNLVCPVAMDDYASDEYTLNYENQKISFCCKTCQEDFLNKPQSFLKNLTTEAQNKALLAINSKFSQTPEPVNKFEKRKTVSNFLGRFHPVVIHFPIALLLTAFFAEILFIVSRRKFFDAAASFMVTTGALGAIVAVILGFLAAKSFHALDSQKEILNSHMWQGCSAAVLASITAFLRFSAHRKHRRIYGSGSQTSKAYRFFLLVTIILIIMTAHLGGTLIYGQDYFSW